MARGKCPTCGRPYEQHTFESSQRMKNVAGMAIPQAPAGPPPGLISARRETPAYLPSRETHLDLPLAQAYAFGRFVAPIGFVIGCAGGFVAAVLADVVMAGVRDTNLTGWGYIGVIGLFGIGGAVIAFFWEAKGKFPERLDYYDALLWKVEEAAGRDIDNDGHIGQPEAPHRVEVELKRNGKPWKFESLEISQDRLIRLARAVASGQSFSNRTASECSIPRDEFNELRDKFVSRGWATWKGEPGTTQGVKLTDEGLDIIAEIATTPLPRAGRGYENSVGRTHPPAPTHGNGDNYEKYEFIER